MEKNNPRKNLILILSAVLLFLSYFFIFLRFFPNRFGLLGHDYSLVFPALLDNYIWIHKNGLFAVPWFTPSFCGGFLNFAHPQGSGYTLPSLLTIFFDPFSVVVLTFVMFAVIGFFSMYLLLNSVFKFSESSSLFGSGLFLFNGFYSHRMLVGHFGFYPFMLIPLLLVFLLQPASKNNMRYMKNLFYILSAGLIFSFMVYSGYLSLMLPTILALVLMGTIYCMLYKTPLLSFWFRLGSSGGVGLILSSSKLVTISYIMKNFTRSSYKLPGFDGILNSAITAFKSIFISPAFEPARIDSFVNLQWYQDRHEWEYSLTIVPLLLIIFGIIKIIIPRIKKHDYNLFFIRKNLVPLIILVLVLSIPVFINTYTPQWNIFLKKIPIIKSASSLIRWYLLYIPFVVLLSSLILEKYLKVKSRWIVVIAGLFLVVFINWRTDDKFYNTQFYNPNEIQEAYYKVKTGKWNPEVKNIAVYYDDKGKAIRPKECNDMLIHDASQILCYEPLLGYNLGSYKLKSLHVGPITDESDGFLNIKNPACYVWSDANKCEPGDHFLVKDKQQALAFAEYRPFKFKMPVFQKIANFINIAAFLMVIIFLFIYIFISMKRSIKE